MTTKPTHHFGTRILVATVILLLCASQGFAILGVWRRHARRWAVVGTAAVASSASAAAAKSSAAAEQSAAAQTAAAQSAAAAAQASAAAAQAAAAKSAVPAQKTPQQQLQELESLYKQGLITESDYNAAKAKILAQVTQ